MPWSQDTSLTSLVGNLAFSESDTVVEAEFSTGFRNVQTTQNVSEGKVYFEIKPETDGGSARGRCGFANSDYDATSYYPGRDPSGDSWCFEYNGQWRTGDTLLPAGLSGYSNGDIVQFAIDFSNGYAWVGVNDTWDGNPANGSDPSITGIHGTDVRGCCLPVFTFSKYREKIDSADWVYTAPTGFTSMAGAATPVNDAGLVAEIFTNSDARVTPVRADGDLFPELFVDSAARVSPVRADGSLYPEITFKGNARGVVNFVYSRVYLEPMVSGLATQIQTTSAYAPLEISVTGFASFRIDFEHTHEYTLWLGYEHIHKWTGGVVYEHIHQYQIPVIVSFEHIHSWKMQASTEASRVHTHRYQLVDYIQVKKEFLQRYSIRADSDAILITLGNVYVTKDGTDIGISQAEVSSDENGFAWTCRVQIPKVEDFFLFNRDEAFTITFLGEQFSFIVDDVSVSRTFRSAPTLVINGISPTATLARPRAETITQEWDTETLASDIADAVTGLSVSWNIIDWTIPANTLAVTDSTPIEVVQLIAKAAGGVVETLPDGTLNVRKKWPVSVPDISTATVDHSLTDGADNLVIQGNVAKAEQVNEIAIRDRIEENTQDQLEFDADGENQTRGIIRVYPTPWRQVTLQTTGGPWVTVQSQGANTRSVTETIEIFNGAGSLRYPIRNVSTVTWNDTSLGGLAYTEGRREVTSTTPTDGNSMVTVRYTTRSRDWEVASPLEEEVQFITDEVDELQPIGIAILAKRDGGGKVGLDIIDPLVTKVDVAVDRGTQELDDKASLKRNELLRIIHRSGLRTGDLIEVSDSLTGEDWRGKIVGVSHQVRGPQAVSVLKAVRPIE